MCRGLLENQREDRLYIEEETRLRPEKQVGSLYVFDIYENGARYKQAKEQTEGSCKYGQVYSLGWTEIGCWILSEEMVQAT